ncbi:DUF1330 domain-containing protein [Xanthomonas tesorieronis]|uniref:DUF1330 domain-containing protein n=1 Tax=Xanthomonas tesorieronis TaxID=3160839 RepID=UPI00351218DA
MKAPIRLWLAFLAVLVSSSFGIRAAQAQSPAADAKPSPAYYVAEFEATDVEGIKPYSARVAGTFKPYGGRFIVRGAVPGVKEGFGAQGRLVVIKFDSLAQAQAWYDSPAYQAIIPIRHRSGNSRTYIVEGMPEP